MVDSHAHDKLKIPQTPSDSPSADQIVYLKLHSPRLCFKYWFCKRVSSEPLEECCAVLWTLLLIFFLVLHSCLFILWGIHAHTEMLSGMLQEGKGFPGVPGTSQLLGSPAGNTAWKMHRKIIKLSGILLKIGYYSIYLVGYGGDVCVCVLWLSSVCTLLNTDRVLLTTGDKMFPALRNLQPRWTLQEDRKSNSSSRWDSSF